jgi:hypothetical protein
VVVASEAEKARGARAPALEEISPSATVAEMDSTQPPKPSRGQLQVIWEVVEDQDSSDQLLQAFEMIFAGHDPSASGFEFDKIPPTDDKEDK